MKTFVSETASPILEVRNLSKSFGKTRVLDDISFSVPKGAVVAIIGPSGSGKSTLLRCLNRLEVPDDGQVLWKETDITKLSAQRAPALRAEIGMVFQRFHLFPHMTALENVMEGPRTVRKMSANAARSRAKDLLNRVGLAEKAGEYPASLSGGQQQRVAIARALAMEPQMMLFDEATSALDPELVGEVLKVMRDLATSGMTMIVVTHEMSFAREAAHRILFTDGGRILEDASPETLFRNPKHERTRSFLSQIL